VTGAPKIRAMEIIRELEPEPRGAYCGAIGWAAPDGRAAFNVAIRTLTLWPDGEALLNVGGGIVADSTAAAEYEEALWKTRFADLMPAT
jgi:para-aminobenzoate synthetase component 1